MEWIILILGTIGHVGLWCVVFNRVHATAFPRNFRKFSEKAILVIVFAPMFWAFYLRIRIPGNSRTRIFSFVVDLPFMDVPKATSISTNCSLLHEEIVAAASEAAAIDQLAAIGLQSWYELSKMEEQLSRKQRTTHSQSSRHRWSLLVEILDYYAYSRDTNVTFQKEEE